MRLWCITAGAQGGHAIIKRLPERGEHRGPVSHSLAGANKPAPYRQSITMCGNDAIRDDGIRICLRWRRNRPSRPVPPAACSTV